MNTLRLKRGDALILAGTILNPPRPADGWTGYTLRAEAMALDSQGEPTGAVIGQFACDWPDRGADAVTLRLETAGAGFADIATSGGSDHAQRAADMAAVGGW